MVHRIGWIYIFLGSHCFHWHKFFNFNISNDFLSYLMTINASLDYENPMLKVLVVSFSLLVVLFSCCYFSILIFANTPSSWRFFFTWSSLPHITSTGAVIKFRLLCSKKTDSLLIVSMNTEGHTKSNSSVPQTKKKMLGKHIIYGDTSERCCN